MTVITIVADVSFVLLATWRRKKKINKQTKTCNWACTFAPDLWATSLPTTKVTNFVKIKTPIKEAYVFDISHEVHNETIKHEIKQRNFE